MSTTDRISATDLRKTYRRVFVGLTLLWILYFAVLAPWMQRRREEAEDSARLTSCIQGFDGPIDPGCMTRAEGLAVIHRTEWNRFSQPSGWLYLFAVGAAFPLLIYGVIAASAAFLARIRRVRNTVPLASYNPDSRFHS